MLKVAKRNVGDGDQDTGTIKDIVEWVLASMPRRRYLAIQWLDGIYLTRTEDGLGHVFKERSAEPFLTYTDNNPPFSSFEVGKAYSYAEVGLRVTVAVRDELLGRLPASYVKRYGWTFQWLMSKKSKANHLNHQNANHP